MSGENNQAAGGGDQNSGANSGKGENQTVSYETYSKTVDEVKSLKAKLKEIETKSQTEIEAKLKEQGDWKTLAESKDAELKTLKQTLQSNEEAITDSIKLGAFQKHLGGKLKSDQYYSFVDTSKIAINPETKKVDEASVKQVVQDFIKEHSHLVDFKKNTKLPNDAKIEGGKGGAGKPDISKMTPAEYEKYILDLAAKGLIKE